MSQSNQTDQPVAHYVVQPQAYRAIVQTLGQLPYNQVAGVIQQLQDQTHVVFADPPAGTIDRSGQSPGKKTAKRPPAKP